MRKFEQLNNVAVRLYEVTGEKDENGENKISLLQEYQSKYSSWGTIDAVGESFSDYAENLGVAHKIEYIFVRDEFYG